MRLEVLLPGSGFPKLRSAVTLLRSEGCLVLVDTGLVGDERRLLEVLSAVAVHPSAIDVVVSTHLHYDHCGNHRLFPRARWIVGTADYDDGRAFMARFHDDGSPGKAEAAAVLRARNETIKEFYVRSIVREVTRNIDFYDMVRTGDGPFECLTTACALTSEVEVIPTPGHTPGHLSVVARAVALPGLPWGTDVLVAGDAVYTRAAFLETDDASSELHLAADAGAYRLTRRDLLSRYTHVVPGHDALVTRADVLPARVEGRAS